MDGKISVEEAIMANRINRAIELLAGDQAIYYVGGHSGHVLTSSQGREDADTWADYINIGMEHGSFDMAGLAEYMQGLIEGGPTRSGHRTPTVIVEAPVNGSDAKSLVAGCTASCCARPSRRTPSAPLSNPAVIRTSRPGSIRPSLQRSSGCMARRAP
jgi:hypothetical protein